MFVCSLLLALISRYVECGFSPNILLAEDKGKIIDEILY